MEGFCLKTKHGDCLTDEGPRLAQAAFRSATDASGLNDNHNSGDLLLLKLFNTTKRTGVDQR